MDDWQVASVPLPEQHGWQARDDQIVVVVDHGAAAFALPRGWTCEPGERGSLRAHDRPPPDDNCRIEVSVLRVRSLAAQPPLATLLAPVSDDDGFDVVERRDPVLIERDGVEIGYTETVYRDEQTGAPALARCCLARARGTTVVVTMDLWRRDAPAFDPVWRDVLDTIQVGRELDVTGGDARRN